MNAASDKLLILGAGLTGLSVAQLARGGTILEREARPGGMAQSFQRDRYTFDFGGHYLHFQDSEAERFFSPFLPVLENHQRESFVLIGEELLAYPIQHSFFQRFPLQTPSLPPHPPEPERSPNLAKHLQATFGPFLWELFFKPYNTKLWKCPLEALQAGGARRWIPPPPTVVPTPAEKAGYNATFGYPKIGGIGKMAANMASGVRVLYGTPAEKIDRAKKLVITKGREFPYQKLISTIPLNALLSLSGHPFPAPSPLGVSILNIGFRGTLQRPFSWIYIPHPSIPFFRVGRYPGGDENRHGLYFEISFREEPPPATEVLLRHARSLLSLLGAQGEVETILRLNLPEAYPTPSLTLSGKLEGLFDSLKEDSIYPAGRMGSWQYLSMADCYNEAKRSLLQAEILKV